MLDIKVKLQEKIKEVQKEYEVYQATLKTIEEKKLIQKIPLKTY